MEICRICNQKEVSDEKNIYLVLGVCSSSCRRRHYYLRRKNQLDYDRVANCLNCGSVFIKTRVDKVACSRNCSSVISAKRRTRGRKRRANVDIIKMDLKKLFEGMKRKSLYVDLSDIFMAIDLYDRIFPNKKMPESVEAIFQKVIDWYIKTNNIK
jgi:hypothetical protein